MEIEFTRGYLKEKNHYYPFGLPMAGIGSSAMGMTPNRQKYQSNEYIKDAGLNWMSFGARQYDPQLGRFLSVDPLASAGGQDMLSPYHAMGNNPVSTTDPEGTADHIVDKNLIPQNFSPFMYGQTSIDGPLTSYTPEAMANMSGYTVFTSDWTSSLSNDVSQQVWISVTGVMFDINGESINVPGIVCNLGPKGNDGPDGGDKGNGDSYNTVDNTDQATDHYYDGKGQPVHLGPNTLKAILTSDDFQYHHKRILNGKTTALSGNFSVNLTSSEFYIGHTNVTYAIGCANGTCKVTYTLFKNDGFWDPNFVAEKTLGRLGVSKYQPDGTGPNLEFSGGTPYWFIPIVTIYQFKDPGY